MAPVGKTVTRQGTRQGPTTLEPLKSILKKPQQFAGSTIATRDARPLFTTTKADKRKIKHERLISRIAKPTAPGKRRRRPDKKLLTTLEDLVDALPAEDGQGKGGSGAGAKAADQVNVIRRKSLKSKPGALKRREKLDKTERERFAKNLAQMAGPKSAAVGEETEVTSTSNRWAALRGFISHTLEQRPDLTSKTAPR